MKSFLNFSRNIFRSQYLIRNLVVRELKARYVGSFLGIFWTIIHPVIQIGIYYFIFSVILKLRAGGAYDNVGFGVWMISGMLPWLYLSETINRSPGTILSNTNLITKTVFPSEILPLIQLIAALVNHALAMCFFIIILLLSGYTFSYQFLWVFPIIIISGTMALGLSWIFSSLNVFLRDIGHLVSVFTQFWFFLTPIIYPISAVPATYQPFCYWNPLFQIAEGYRAALLGNAGVDWLGMGYLLNSAIIIAIIGGIVFRKLKPAFPDVL